MRFGIKVVKAFVIATASVMGTLLGFILAGVFANKYILRTEEEIVDSNEVPSQD
jgi:hypothetical protein